MAIGCAIASLVCVAGARAQVNPEIRISTDKRVYAEGDPVSITVTAVNNSPEAIELNFPTSRQVDYTIDGRAYRWSDGEIFLEMFTSVSIPANESHSWETFVHMPEDYALERGVHLITGEVVDYGRAGRYISVGGDFPLPPDPTPEPVPEPPSEPTPEPTPAPGLSLGCTTASLDENRVSITLLCTITPGLTARGDVALGIESADGAVYLFDRSLRSLKPLAAGRKIDRIASGVRFDLPQECHLVFTAPAGAEDGNHRFIAAVFTAGSNEIIQISRSNTIAR